MKKLYLMIDFQLVFELVYFYLLQVKFPFLYTLNPEFFTFSGGIEMEQWPDMLLPM